MKRVLHFLKNIFIKSIHVVQKVKKNGFYATAEVIYHFICKLFQRKIEEYGLKKYLFRFPAFLYAKKLPLNADRYLVIAPHPDDEVFGCAGIIHRLSQLGKKVHVVILTQGEAVHDEPKIDIQTLVARRRELALDAAKIMGLLPEQYSFFDWGDDKVREDNIHESKVKELVTIIDAIKPEVIFTPHLADVHLDHTHTAKIVSNLISPSTKQIYYCVWLLWYQSHKPQWNKSYVLKMSKKERFIKEKAMDAYVLPIDEYGMPYSGDLRELASITRWRKELFFEAQ